MKSPVCALLLLVAGGASLSDAADAKPRSPQQRLASEHKPKVASFIAKTAGVSRKASAAIHAADPQVWCGGMFAASCSSCPQGNGESWCHGECSWAEGLCNAKAPPTTTESPRPSTTTESPRPSTTTESPRPSTSVVESLPSIPKVLVQHSAQSTATAAPSMWPFSVDASALTPPGAAKPQPQAVRVVKFTPPAVADSKPPAATPQAAPQAVRKSVKFTPPTLVKSDPQAAAVPEAAMPQAAVAQAAVAQAVVPQAVVPQAVVPQAVVPQAVAPQAVVPQAVVPPAVVPQAVVPQAVVPQAVAPEFVKRTVKFTPPAVASQESVAHPASPFVHTAAVTPAPAGHFLASNKKADECACAFHGDCTCEASMAFMECISSSCAEGCECHDMQYHDACEQLSDACTPVGLSFTCDQERAVCLDSSKSNSVPASSSEPATKTIAAPEAKPLPHIQAPPSVDTVTALYHSLTELKEDKCALGLAVQAGYVNADSRLTGVQLQIEDSMSKLGDRCLKLPEMHCEKDFEEWSFPQPPCGNEDESENPMRDTLKDASEYRPDASEYRSGASSPAAVSLLALGVAAFAAIAGKI